MDKPIDHLTKTISSTLSSRNIYIYFIIEFKCATTLLSDNIITTFVKKLDLTNPVL